MKQSNRLIIVAYRIPFKIVIENEERQLIQNSGGLVSAILSLSQKKDATNNENANIHWFGYSEPGTLKEGEEVLSNDQFDVHPVIIENDLNEKYYEGFCNSTIWPISHYYPYLTTYNEEDFDAYVEANKLFAEKINDFVEPGDTVWIHDYQLMLLPALIREKHPNVHIGYFHHIPFPSFEIFRLIPKKWQLEIIKGLLGADLIGFHTNDYAQYFLNTVQRLLGYDYNIRDINTGVRLVRVDTFPISIDYDKFSNLYTKPEVQEKRKEILKEFEGRKIIFCVDRLDYSKGIRHRLNALEFFLEHFPEWKDKVVLVMVVVPSRDTILQYQEMKHDIEETVGRINGKFGTLTWRPVVYMYRSLSMDELGALYTASDIALITPTRDGMNLVAKEFVATRQDKNAVLILSEMAGAALELNGALLINPSDTSLMANTIQEALLMNDQEKSQRMQLMQDRIKNYDIFRWTEDYMEQLESIIQKQKHIAVKIITPEILENINALFKTSSRRLFLLDYDGTLSPIVNNPSASIPASGIIETLSKLTKDFNVNVAIVSGRDKAFLSSVFDDSVILSAEHGAFLKLPGQDWEMQYDYKDDWKDAIEPLLKKYTIRCAGSFIENKATSLAWHYRNSESEYAFMRSRELLEDLNGLPIGEIVLSVVDGDKVVEIKPATADKGVVAAKICNIYNPDFILSIGDDTTDEDMFQILPENAITIKVGVKKSQAQYNVTSQEEVGIILNTFLNELQ